MINKVKTQAGQNPQVDNPTSRKGLEDENLASPCPQSQSRLRHPLQVKRTKDNDLEASCKLVTGNYTHHQFQTVKKWRRGKTSSCQAPFSSEGEMFKSIATQIYVKISNSSSRACPLSVDEDDAVELDSA